MIFAEGDEETNDYEKAPKYNDCLNFYQTHMNNNIERFIEAQKDMYCGYAQALKEMQEGGKRSHWIWYIFPQLAGLGSSYMSQLYGIKGKNEAEEYLAHPVLGQRLREITEVILSYPDIANPNKFMMQPFDAKKLQSSMTLFDAISPNDIFDKVLERFFNGTKDRSTLRLIQR